MKLIRIFSSLLLALAVPLANAAQPEPQDIEKLDPNFAAKDPKGNILWHDIRNLVVEGQGWPETDRPFDRLPARAKGLVRDPVWRLSLHSAGVCARFTTDSREVSARWTLRFSNLAMNHMPATGVSGVDLYVKDGGRWRWVAAGRPNSATNQVALITTAPEGFHEYLLYLPLYNGVESVEVGVLPDSTLAKAPARDENRERPIVFYGTSITQGGCASRPGMAHPAILGRRLDQPSINLGFSGNGKLDAEFVDLLAEIDAAVYVLDCAPNMNPEMVAERTAPFVRALREKKPNVPILLVENIVYQNGWFVPKRKSSYVDKNAALKAAYEALVSEGIGNIHYLPCEALLGDDGEATVDGTHPTDLGFHRMADAFEGPLREILR